MKKNSTVFLKGYAICVSIICCITISAFLFIFFREGYDEKIMARMGIQEYTSEPSWAVGGWNNMLMKLDYDADVVFLGDSITYASDFHKSFEDVKIVNLGYCTDTLSGMIQRVPGVAAVTPEKVFLLGGINGLTDKNIKTTLQTYTHLLEELENALPDAEIYIQSVLPIASTREIFGCHNTTIQQFNTALAALADSKGMTYVDLHSLYVKDGELDAQYSRDGLHLLPNAYRLWEEAIADIIE